MHKHAFTLLFCKNASGQHAHCCEHILASSAVVCMF